MEQSKSQSSLIEAVFLTSDVTVEVIEKDGSQSSLIEAVFLT